MDRGDLIICVRESPRSRGRRIVKIMQMLRQIEPPVSVFKASKFTDKIHVVARSIGSGDLTATAVYRGEFQLVLRVKQRERKRA